MSSEPVFEPDADLDHWLNMLDCEIVFEPEPEENEDE